MKREGTQMKSIALLTMIYLPISCVAVYNNFNHSPYKAALYY